MAGLWSTFTFAAVYCLAILVNPGGAIEAKCTACQAVAAELQRRIDNEKPRNHVDLRHRLDSEGHRYGKVIEYKRSELRAVEILDGICSTMKDYTLVTFDDPENGKKYKRWTKVRGVGAATLEPNATKPDGTESEAREKQLNSFCGSLLEEHDEDVTQALVKGDMDERDSVAPLLCSKIAKACKLPPVTKQPAEHSTAQAEL